MNILLTNDDGIHAKGLECLYDAVADLGDVTVVAPDCEMSATSHSITMTDPLRTKSVPRNGSHWGTAVTGTPSDAAKLAITSLMPEKPDLVISGINQGVNSGLAAIYSGTVAAASEGTFHGIMSMAVSLASKHHQDYQPAAQITRTIAKKLINHEIPYPQRALLNINVPPIPIDEIKGIRLTRQGLGGFKDIYERRLDPRGQEYYWLDGGGFIFDEHTETDDYLVQQGYVTITPLRFDLTDYQWLETEHPWLAELRLKDTN
jgi:5'-nucleotidase